MGKDLGEYRVKPDEKVDLKKWATRIKPVYASKEDYRTMLEEHVERLSKLQELLYASNRYAVLIIFQAMDAAGKDGCIKHVMSGVNPQGCKVSSFSHPTPVEQRHDFLWRTTRELPERGQIAIFNRSYYEEVLVVRVHPEILKAEAIPEDGDTEKVWQQRFRSIEGLESHLHENGTRIIKFFLHVSKDEQRQRLLDRIVKPEKNFKIQQADIAERNYWKEYREAYEDCIANTTSKVAPWYIVPADDKLTARLIVSQVIVKTLEKLDLSLPATTPARRAELDAMRKALESN